MACFTNYSQGQRNLNIKSRKLELLQRTTTLAGVTDGTIKASLGGIPETDLLRHHIPTASMPFSRSPDISLHMLFSMSRLHILWYSLKTVKIRFQKSVSQKSWHWCMLNGLVLITFLNLVLKYTHKVLKFQKLILHC